MNKVEYIEHTADVGIKVYGDDLQSLFTYAARGMFSILYEGLETLLQQTATIDVNKEECRKIEVVGRDLEVLLISWLNELLYYYSVEKILFYRFNILHLTTSPTENKEGLSLSAEAHGIKLSLLGIKPHIEIKAATYHKLKIIHTEEGTYCAEIFFDV